MIRLLSSVFRIKQKNVEVKYDKNGLNYFLMRYWGLTKKERGMVFVFMGVF